MLERLKGLYADDGTAHDVFEAVAAVEPTSIADFEHRVRAVSDFRALAEAEALASANKRISNILRKAEGPIAETVDPDLFELTAEKELYDQLQAIDRQITPMLADANYGAMLQALARLRAPVDRFFDDVMVMAEKQSVRANRLAMLRSLGQQFLRVADVSELRT
jgi:glycyl-tRNA synthetase beta chain